MNYEKNCLLTKNAYGKPDFLNKTLEATIIRDDGNEEVSICNRIGDGDVGVVLITSLWY